ncbi:MAG: MFS transporter [Terriglobales bacterium]
MVDATGVVAARPEPSRLYRWTVLLFVSVAMGGNYYIYDSINPLERIFIDKLGFSATAFGWLNSSYSVAAVLTLLIGGIIIDRIGTKKAMTVFAVLCLLGAALTAARGQPGVMIAGRTVLGLGTAYALMTLIQQIGFFILNLLIGKANDYSHAGLDNPGGYGLGMWIFSILGFVGLTFAILLRIRETGPHGHGLETITAKG